MPRLEGSSLARSGAVSAVGLKAWHKVSRFRLGSNVSVAKLHTNYLLMPAMSSTTSLSLYYWASTALKVST